MDTVNDLPPSRSRRRLWLVVALLCAAVAVGIWAKSRNRASRPLTEVRFGYFANLSHAQAVLGVSSGDLERAVGPAKLKTRVFNAGPSVIEALFAGEIDIAYIGPGPVLAGHARSKGDGVRVIAGAAANGVLIVARKDSGINTLKDLAGKRIATPQHGNTQDIAARHYVVNQLGQKDHHNILAIPNAEQSSMMDRGQIDAAWAPEPWGSRLVVETGATVIAAEKDLWPGGEFALAVVITTPEFLEKHPAVVEKMIEVHRAWTAKLAANPKQHLPQLGAALNELTGKKLPPGVLDAAVANVKFTNDPSEATFRTMAQWAYDLDFERQPARMNRLFDLTILKKLESAEREHARVAP